MNYVRHNKELDGTLYKPEEPVIFTKADSALLKDRKPFFVPDFMGRIDYEAELVVRICRLGKSIPQRFAHRYYDAVTLGAAIGEWVDIGRFRDIQAINLRLDINGSTVQQACTGDMIFAVDELISYISKYFTLKTGDLIYTGTPAGTGPVAIGDRLEGWLDDRKVLWFSCR